MPNKRHNSLLFWADFRWLTLVLMLGAVLGWLITSMPWGMTIGLLGYATFRMITMRRFLHWINQATLQEPPKLSGGLSYVAHQLYQSRLQEQLTHQRMMGLVKKIRRSLSALQDSVIILDKHDRLEWWNN